MKKKLLINLIIASIITTIIYFWRGLTMERLYPTVQYFYLPRHICDTFAFVGLIYIFIGLIFFVSNAGAFDSLTFGIKKTLSYWGPFKNENLQKNLFEYVQAKSDRPKIKVSSFLIVGAIFLAISIILLYAYNLV